MRSRAFCVRRKDEKNVKSITLHSDIHHQRFFFMLPFFSMWIYCTRIFFARHKIVFYDAFSLIKSWTIWLINHPSCPQINAITIHHPETVFSSQSCHATYWQPNHNPQSQAVSVSSFISAAITVICLSLETSYLWSSASWGSWYSFKWPLHIHFESVSCA